MSVGPDEVIDAGVVDAVVRAEARFRALSELTQDAVLWLRVGDDFEVLHVNEAATELTGMSRAELRSGHGPLLDYVLHPDDRSLVAVPEPGSAEETGALVRWRRQDGSIVWVEQRLIALGGTESELLCVARDVTDRINAGTMWAQRESQQQAVSALSRKAATSTDPRGLAVTAVEVLERITAADAVAVWWELEPGGDFELVAHTGLQGEHIVSGIADSVTSHAGRTRLIGGPTRIDGMDIRQGHVGRELRDQHLTGGLGVPVRSRHGVVGAVATYYRRESDPTTDTLLLESLASILAAAADRSTYDEEIGFRALHDPLTGLPNRALFTDHVARLVPTLGLGEDVGIVVCDVDDFTLMNQALGREAADDILVEVARRIGASVGDLIVARIGSDDFAVAVPGLTRSGRLEAVASTIVEAMQLPVVARARSHPVTVSVGLALTSDEDAVADAVEAAGAAARVAKERSRGSWSHASGREQELALRRLDLTNGLRRGIEAGEVVPHYQPLVDVTDGTVKGFEALARWIREDGIVPPLDFIPIAEETGLIAPLGLSVLMQACAFLEQLHGGRDLKMSVNVSPVQLNDPRFVHDVERLLDASTLPREALCLELTETALVPGDQETIDQLLALRDLGVTLAIDDFGTGYSSFAYLTQFPIDVLKLDRALVSGVHERPARRAVITAVVTLAHDLGIQVLAEGVETEEERDALVELGCDLGQGWFWGRPQPADQARSLIA